VWALDFQFDETAGLRRLELFNIVDEFTREALAIDAAHSSDSDGVVGAVERLERSAAGRMPRRPTPVEAYWWW
jgi:hypothetical protein